MIVVGFKRWSHEKRQTTYKEICRAPLQKSGDYILKEGDILVTYQDEKTLKFYHRYEPEFEDGRFKQLEMDV